MAPGIKIDHRFKISLNKFTDSCLDIEIRPLPIHISLIGITLDDCLHNFNEREREREEGY